MGLLLTEIIEQLGGNLNQKTDILIERVGSIAHAQAGAITFLSDAKYAQQLNSTQASAVILKPEHAMLTQLPCIVTSNPYAYFAKVSQLLNPAPVPKQGVESSAAVHNSAIVPSSCSIGAHVVLEAGVVLGEHVVIGAGTVVEAHSRIGTQTVLESNVTVKHHCNIGERCHLFSGCVIGNDGFGYAEENGRWVKIPQVGRVIIEDDVDIGANTTIDRGAIDDTLIETGVKMDNLIQIAHNCRIGAHTVIAGCVGIAGSAVIGKHCKIGGAAMILGHLNITDNVTISPGSMIMRSISEAGTYTALMPSQEHTAWLKTAANIRQLTQLADRIKTLEAELAKRK